MNPTDRSFGSLPARQTELVPAPPVHEHDDAFHDLPPTGNRITFRLVARALRRHWWQALALWLVGSVGLMAVAYFKVYPSYIAFARIIVEPGERGLFTQGNGNNDFADYKETQVSIISSPRVIETALAQNPEILNFPRLRLAEDHSAEIRSALNVSIVPKTNLIDVSMVSESTLEATAIVNAVVRAYLKNAADDNNQENVGKVDRLKTARDEKLSSVKLKRDALKQLQQKIGDGNITELKGRNSVTVEEYGRLSSELTQIQVQIFAADAKLSLMQNDQSGPVAVDEGRPTERDIQDMFYSHPRVVDPKNRFERAIDRYKSTSHNIRDKSDPSLIVHLKARNAAKEELDNLWAELEPVLRAQARAGVGRPVNTADHAVREAELHLLALKSQETALTEKLKTLSIKRKDEGAAALALEFENIDLKSDQAYLDTIERNLADLEFVTKNPIARIREGFMAKPTNKASTSNRTKIMAMAPVGMMFGVLCLLVLLELSAGRVVDPEDIPARIRVPVIGVVPPLPQIRPANGVFSARDEFRTQRQLDQFVQSLDHLRVALCSGRNAWGRERRCILITSACGSEGKTTLAAQLAERCVNAGLNTLLIDGDLRNPTLSRMLDVPNSRGLINVLRGEVAAEEAMAIIGGAGGFHFMPAGTPKVDPSRLLQSERLGKLLTQAREAFDIVIVDAPPVLPVPDALTIGRWTDGAVLAVRYDMSRFPLVEKANRRLATVGVPVIGAVVNGVRIQESTYGSYYPSYAYSNDRAAQTPLDV